MPKYLIADAAYFDGGHYELTSAQDPERVVNLGARPSHCLLALLQAEGRVVTTKVLLHQGWEQYGSVVTSNSVNQAVAHIRKCFQELGIAGDGIITIPRIGYRLALPVVAYSRDAPSVPDDLDVPLAAEPVPPAPQPAAMDGPAPAALPARQRQTVSALIALVVLAIVSSATALLAAPALRRNFMQAAPRIDYVSVATRAEIAYFATRDFAGNQAFMARSIAMLEKYPPASVPARRYPQVYINGALRDGVFSYFLCQAAIVRKDAACVSYLILSEAAA